MVDEYATVPTHVDGLDAALGGGIPKGSLVLVTGTPGTMKTSLVFHLMMRNAKAGRRGLYVTLEEGSDHLRAAMGRLGLGPMDDSYVYILDLAQVRAALKKDEVGKDWVAILLGIVREAVQSTGYEMLAIDSLEALYTIADLTEPRREMFHIFAALRELGLTTFVISEMEVGDVALAKFGEDFLADGIIQLRRVEIGETDAQLRLRIVKMRMMDHSHVAMALTHTGGRFLVSNVISRRS